MNLNPVRWFIKNQAEEYSLSDDAVLRVFLGAVGAMTSAGINVTQENALRCITVLACMIVRAETFSALPGAVFRLDGKASYPDPDNPADRLLNVSPNELMTAGELWRWKQLREDRTGNAHVRIVWRGYDPAELWPLTGEKPRLFRDDRTGAIAYQYTGDDLTPANVYPARDILHFKGVVLQTPWEGKSLIDLASETIGIAIASEQFFGRLLGNGAHFPGYLETDKDLDPKDITAIQEQLKGFSGVLGAGIMRIFDRGLKYKQNAMTIKDVDLTPQMRWQMERICAVFRVPLALVMNLERGTYTNSEEQDLWLAKHTITPICTETEQVLRFRLFTRQLDRRQRWNLDGLLRGDYKTRTEGDGNLVTSGVIDRNEARSHYDYNPRVGLEKPFVPQNLAVVEEDGSITPANDPSAAPAAASVLEPVLRDAVACIRRRYETDQKRRRDREETVAFAATKLGPLAEAYARAGVVFDAQQFVSLILSGDGALTIPGDDGHED